MFLASTNNWSQLTDVVAITAFSGIIQVLHPKATEHKGSNNCCTVFRGCTISLSSKQSYCHINVNSQIVRYQVVHFFYLQVDLYIYVHNGSLVVICAVCNKASAFKIHSHLHSLNFILQYGVKLLSWLWLILSSNR